MCLGAKSYAFGHGRKEFPKGTCSWWLNGIYLLKGSEDSSKAMRIHLTLAKSVLSLLSYYLQQDWSEGHISCKAATSQWSWYHQSLSYKLPRNQAQSTGYSEDWYPPSLKWPSELSSLCQMPYVFQQAKQNYKLLGHSLSFIEFRTSPDLNQSLSPP